MQNNNHNNVSMHGGHNDAIGCNVSECAYHANAQDFCTLEHIKVIKHEQCANTAECTDCASFKKS